MRLGPFEIKRVPSLASASGASPPMTRAGAWTTIFESFPGAWQRGVTVNNEAVLAQATVFACISLIAQDIGKLGLHLVECDANDVWTAIYLPPYNAVLRKPNRYQTRQLFMEQWLVSKLTHGNAYVLKERDQRGQIIAHYILDPTRVQPLVAPDGAVYYQLQQDNLAQITESLPAVPASEIIHDRAICLFHPLVGVSPIFACGLAATQALKIARNSAAFFDNMSRPSGILTAPAQIGDELAERLKREWEANFTGDKIGKVAVLGDGLGYQAMSINAVDAQLVEQLKLSAEQICAVFHVPPYMVGAAPAPAYNNIEALNQQYYNQCLQTHMEGIETMLDEGLGLTEIAGRDIGVEFDLDDLMKMDSATQIDALNKGVGGGWMKPNEARASRNMKPVTGGDTPYLQQQNYSLAALDKRDSQPDPFASSKPALPAPTAPAPAPMPPAPKAIDSGAHALRFVAKLLDIEAETV